jgi:hypothetical protein
VLDPISTLVASAHESAEEILNVMVRYAVEIGAPVEASFSGDVVHRCRAASSQVGARAQPRAGSTSQHSAGGVAVEAPASAMPSSVSAAAAGVLRALTRRAIGRVRIMRIARAVICPQVQRFQEGCHEVSENVDSFTMFIFDW